VIVDRPADKGGSDRGPLGGEYLLVSLGGCFLSTLLAAVKARDAEVSNVRVSVVGTVDGSPERFESMAMHVTRPLSERSSTPVLTFSAQTSRPDSRDRPTVSSSAFSLRSRASRCMASLRR